MAYVKPGKNTSKKVIEKRLEKLFKENKVRYEPHDLDATANCLHMLNRALLKKWEVRAVIEKEPRNLDSGRHYFSVEFSDGKNGLTTFWPGHGNESIARFFGMSIWNRDWSVPKYSFSSGAIGMSRKLDATDSLFRRLQQITGTYAQI